MSQEKLSRRSFLRAAAMTAVGVALAACAQPTPQVITKVETVVVEKEKVVEKPVVQTVVVEKEKVVEKPVVQTVVVEKEKVVKETVVVEKAPTPVPQVMIGAFDVGPHGCPQCYDPQKRSVGWLWLCKLWAPLAMWNLSQTNVEPELAESWSSNADATVWTLKLRKGLKWSDGQPLTTKDLYFAAKLRSHKDYAIAPPSGPTVVVGQKDYYEGKAEEISGLKVIDDVTIECHFEKPNPLFPFYQTSPVEIAEHHFKKWTPAELKDGNQWFEWRPCSGPFEWSKFVRDQYTEATPNPYYWRGKPKLDKLINRYFSTETPAVLALQRGEIDFTYISGDVVNPIKQTAGFTVHAGPSMVANFIIFNFNEPALQDLRVRQAFMHAIDRQKIINTLYNGMAIKINALFSQPEYQHPNMVDYEYNPEKAKQLLKEAGWKQTEDWEIWTYYTDQLSQNVLQAIQRYLAEVGIKVVPRMMDVPTFNNLFPVGKDWKVAYIGQGHSGGPRDARGRWAEGGQPKFEGKCKCQHGCYPDIEKVTALITDYETNLDPQARVKAAQEIALIMNQQLPDAYMWVTERYGAVNNRVKNFIFRPLIGGGPYYDKAELWEIVP